MTLDNLSRKAVILYGYIQGCGGGALDEWQMRDKTGLSHGTICAARKELVDAGLLTLGKDGRRTTYLLTSQAEKSTGTLAESDRMTEPAPAEAAHPVEAAEPKALTALVEVPPPPAVKAGVVKPAAPAAAQAEMPRVTGTFESIDDWMGMLTVSLGGCVNVSESLVTPNEYSVWAEEYGMEDHYTVTENEYGGVDVE
ncbi:hypothetical protein [Selenomonas ruminantium]|uniref:hypothetical protein n=1 Tax=Selenomonas ruminantium TaxID=971 RepID=UPI0026F1024A|nr:hypothetical protein [Selenomonas ruminantium]